MGVEARRRNVVIGPTLENQEMGLNVTKAIDFYLRYGEQVSGLPEWGDGCKICPRVKKAEMVGFLRSGGKKSAMTWRSN